MACEPRDDGEDWETSVGTYSSRLETSGVTLGESVEGTVDDTFVSGRNAVEIGAAPAGSMRWGVTCRMGVTEPIHTKDPKVTANIASLMRRERIILRGLPCQMDGPSMDIFHGFHEAFRKGRMRVNHVGHL